MRETQWENENVISKQLHKIKFQTNRAKMNRLWFSNFIQKKLERNAPKAPVCFTPMEKYLRSLLQPIADQPGASFNYGDLVELESEVLTG